MNSLQHDEIEYVSSDDIVSLCTPFILNTNIKVVLYTKTIESNNEQPTDINSDGTLFLKYQIPSCNTDVIEINTGKRYNTEKFLQISGLDIDITSVLYKPLLMFYPVTVYVKIQNPEDKPQLTYTSYFMHNTYRKSFIYKNL